MFRYQHFTGRNWQSADYLACIEVVRTVLAEYGLSWQPESTDRDILDVRGYYQARGGCLWVIEDRGQVIGTGGYCPDSRGNQAVEVRKMYLLRQARGRGLGSFLLGRLEAHAHVQGYREAWIETDSILTGAVQLYESKGYHLIDGAKSRPCCNRVYRKLLIPGDTPLREATRL
ncbi:MAG: GNAT family N-acetyltransferase [Gemmatimonadaceae bacterium]|nr:GNAT family N-acetyltransferase [Gloeobacterales cyanobacterium ES-bin-141]